jgi:glutamate dehydrogenase
VAIIATAVGRSGPVIEMFEIEGSREKRLVIAYRQGKRFSPIISMLDSFGEGLGLANWHLYTK